MTDRTRDASPQRNPGGSKLPKRTIAVVDIRSPEDLADSLATACRGRIAALALLRDAIGYLEGTR